MKDEFMNYYQETQEEIIENIFISWSGKKSKDIASKIKLWLPKVIPSIRPWMSEDIEAGKRWSPEIAKQLSDSRLGIICVARENMNSGWLLFEAGAISKELDDDTRIYPILIDLSLSDLKYPLAQFQAIELTQDGSNILKLISSLNQITRHPFPPSVVTILFEYYWPELKEQIFETKEFSYSYSDVYRFQNISDQNFFNDLFERIDYNEITSIDVWGHTGENLIKGFLGVLSANKELMDCLIEKEIIIRILLRDPISEVEPFPEVIEIIRKVSEKYNLVIIAATDENIIKDYLCQPSFMAAHKPFYDCFKYVFGKREPDFKWQNMDRKNQLIHRITSLIGVPVERMVYVGDNNMDFEAASRINIDFIEARLFSDEVEKSIGRKSLIKVDNGEHPHFISWSEFCEKLEEVEKFKKERRKEQYEF